MNTKPLEKFAQAARRQLQEQVAAKLERVLRTDSAELRGRADAVHELKRQLAEHGRAAVIERVAYTWFNRFCALRYMDANRYTRLGVVSPAAGFTQPEILQEAKQGQIDDELTLDAQRVRDLLSGQLPSPDPQQEAYRLLLVAVCNHYHASMPFLFERIADYSELLMPDDLLSTSSVLSAMRAAMSVESCQNVEVIGWLYQFYISEKKDEVFAALKQNQKISAANIPAATQLFTPHWIVRYLVENSLARLWLLNHPTSRLAEKMPYYIENAAHPPESTPHTNQPVAGAWHLTDFLRINSPEEIRLCDPAAGSGHMLTYAFDLLYAIYEEEGYNPPDIPRLILSHNLYGIEIDARAGALAAFALTMKALHYDKRFLRRKSAAGEPGKVGEPVEPNICVLQAIHFSEDELKHEAWLPQEKARRAALLHDLHLFADADNVGSLLRPQLRATQIASLKPNLTGTFAAQKALLALEQAEYLTQRYHVVVANPPYMGGGGMNDELTLFAKREYPDSKSDLFAMFMQRNLGLAMRRGFVGMVTMQSWMFLSSFDQLRQNLLTNQSIATLIQIGYNSFPELNSKVAQACAFVLSNGSNEIRGGYLNLNDAPQAADKEQVFLSKKNNGNVYWIGQQDFTKIPGSPIAYWVKGISLFDESSLGNMLFSGGRTKTHNNDLYLRFFWEVSKDNNDWKLLANGGDFRKYYGNILDVIDWSLESRAQYEMHGGLANSKFWDKEGITWTLITSAVPGFRSKHATCHYSSAAPTIFNRYYTCDLIALAFLNSPIARYFLRALNPTLNTTVGDVLTLPFPELESINQLKLTHRVV